MLDDHQYSLNRIVAYNHREPGNPIAVYGPGGPERTYGLITEVSLVGEEPPHWEYMIKNTFTGEESRVREEDIFHGANQGYLDIHRRDGIYWFQQPPTSARSNSESKFWKRTVRQFVRTSIPSIREREEEEERARDDGRSLPLGPGDYIKVRGDLRRDVERHHNMYAKVLSVSPADIEHMVIPRGKQGIASGKHKVLLSYRVLLDDGTEADIYDVEVKAFYTTHGRTIILNWKATTFLAEAFGDDLPYDLQLEYLNGHVFSRPELADMSSDDLGDLLSRLLYVKGLITSDELVKKAELFSKSPHEYLVDQVLSVSRFDMKKNRSMTSDEIAEFRSGDDQLKHLFDGAGD